ncbi:MAG: pyroglutamyl-peptidase I [Clostridia bacterium]|nr:pyroglutamyl-peptidase I [Clostridia bacterium]
MFTKCGNKKLLITGFDPFGGQSVNPAREAVMQLPDVIGEWQLIKKELPTVYGLAAEQVLQAAAQLQPDAILCVGQAGGRTAVTPEVIGVNLRHARIADNAGNAPLCQPIVSGAPASYYTTLPVRNMVSAVRAAGVPCELSYSAGRFVCNDLLYTLLHHYHSTQTRVGFIHIPYVPEQAKSAEPSMELDQAVKALSMAIAAI